VNIELIPCDRKLWEQFKDFHYQHLPLSKSSRCHLAVAEIDGVRKVIGFCASIPMRGKYDKFNRKAHRAHKTVVRLRESPAMFQLWALVSDAQAQLHVAEGVKFYSVAPRRYADYRDNPNSNWVRSSKDNRRKKSGLRSHEYRRVPTSNDKHHPVTGEPALPKSDRERAA